MGFIGSARSSVGGRLFREVLLSAALSFLPWLQIKFGITAALLLAAVAWRMVAQDRLGPGNALWVCCWWLQSIDTAAAGV
jgi:hypothetical protein